MYQDMTLKEKVVLRDQLKDLSEVAFDSMEWSYAVANIGEDFKLTAFTLYLYVKNDCKLG